MLSVMITHTRTERRIYLLGGSLDSELRFTFDMERGSASSPLGRCLNLGLGLSHNLLHHDSEGGGSSIGAASGEINTRESNRRRKDRDVDDRLPSNSSSTRRPLGRACLFGLGSGRCGSKRRKGNLRLVQMFTIRLSRPLGLLCRFRLIQTGKWIRHA